MAKIEDTEKKKFIPYKIVVESQEEHDFLLGIVRTDPFNKIIDAPDYDSDISIIFYNLFSNLR